MEPIEDPNEKLKIDVTSEIDEDFKFTFYNGLEDYNNEKFESLEGLDNLARVRNLEDSKDSNFWNDFQIANPELLKAQGANDSVISNLPREYLESLDVTSNKLSSISEIKSPVLGEFTGVFARRGSYSGNSRYYPKGFWEAVISSNRVQKDLARGRFIGIFEHPQGAKRKAYNQDGLMTAFHPCFGAFVTKELTIKGDDVIGTAYLLNTPNGRILTSYMLARDKYNKPMFKLAISSRAYGREIRLDEQGIDQMTPDDYVLVAFDIVMNPGIPDVNIHMTQVSESLESKSEGLVDPEKNGNNINTQSDEELSLKIYKDKLEAMEIANRLNLKNLL